MVVTILLKSQICGQIGYLLILLCCQATLLLQWTMQQHSPIMLNNMLWPTLMEASNAFCVKPVHQVVFLCKPRKHEALCWLEGCFWKIEIQGDCSFAGHSFVQVVIYTILFIVPDNGASIASQKGMSSLELNVWYNVVLKTIWYGANV